MGPRIDTSLAFAERKKERMDSGGAAEELGLMAYRAACRASLLGANTRRMSLPPLLRSAL